MLSHGHRWVVLCTTLTICSSLYPPLQAAQPGRPAGQALVANSTNTNAGARSRTVLWLPQQHHQTESEETAEINIQVLFSADFNIDHPAAQIRLCYVSHGGNTTPSHSQCVAELPTTMQRKVGPGRDLLWIKPHRSPDPKRSIGLVIDAINPLETGTHTIEAFHGSGLTLRAQPQPIGTWQIRINPSDWDD